MRSIKQIGILLLAFLLLFGTIGCRKAESNYENAYDFTELSGGGLPLGWTVVSYEGTYEASAKDGVVTLSTFAADDLRLTRTESVEADRFYRMTAEIRTEGIQGGQGATLSIDNYGMGGNYLYSDALFGNQDWTEVSLTFLTAKGQEEILLALRIGGYSNVTQGTASFRNVRLEKCDDTPSQFQILTIKGEEDASGSNQSAEDYENLFSAIFWSTAVIAIVLLFGIYRKREQLFLAEFKPQRRWSRFLLLIGIGFVVRLILCAVVKGHASDLGCWVSWGEQIANGNWAKFYDGTWYDYPPGYMYILGGLTKVMRLFGANNWPETLRIFWYMMPAFVADIVCAYLLMRFCDKQKVGDAVAFVLVGLVLLNPAAMFLSGAWAQIDSILTALLLATFLLLNERKWIWAAVVYAFAVLMKWQALIYGPVLAMVYLAWALGQNDRKARIRALWKTAIAVVAAVAIIIAASLPFRGSMSFFWIVERFMTASGGYDYASVEGYNFLTLLGGNWTKSSMMLLKGASFTTSFGMLNEIFGKLAMLIGLPILALRAWRTKPNPKTKEMTQELTLLLTTLALLAVAKLIHYALEASKGWNVQLYSLVMLGSFAFALYPYWRQAQKNKRWALPVEYQHGLLALGIGLACLVFVLLFGNAMSFKTFGTLQIGIGLLLTLLLLLMHRKSYLAARKELHKDRGLPFLLASFFMLWVFTFGHYMHERYVFPVLFLLLFSYAFYREKRFLLVALLLTVTTFFNEVMALYVVSEGAIDFVRGGTIHNQMLWFGSLLEVASALYAFAVCFLHAKQGNTEPESIPFVVKRLEPVSTEPKKAKKGGKKHA